MVATTSPFFRRVVKGTFWITAGSIISRGLLSCAYIYLARFLTTQQNGEYGILKTTIDHFLIFASLGIGLTTTKFVSELKNNENNEAGEIIGTSVCLVLTFALLVATTILFSSHYLSVKIFKNAYLEKPLSYSAFILVFISLFGVLSGSLLGFAKYRYLSICNIIQGVASFIGLSLGAYLGGVLGAITGNLLAMLISSLVALILVNKAAASEGLKISVRNIKKNATKIYKFAIPASLSTIIVSPTIWFVNTLLIRSPDGYLQLGIYSAVIIFSMGIQMLNGSLNNVLLPMFLGKNVKITAKVEFFNYYGAFYITIFLSLPLLLFPQFVSLLIGPKYPINSVRLILSISLFSNFIVANRQGSLRDLIIKGQMWLNVISMAQWSITTIIFFYIFSYLGAVGYALSFCLSYVINHIVYSVIFIKKRISPGAVFYNSNILFQWLILVLITLTAIFVESTFSRVLIISILATFLFTAAYKLLISQLKKIDF